MNDRTDPLTAALLPAVLHKLGNATQILSGVNALLSIEGGGALALERTGDLAVASRTIHRLGWAMAVLASASGSNLLLERREPDGLEVLVELVGDAARRAARTLAPPSRKLPRLAPSALAGWQVPWGIAALLHAATTDTESCTWDLALEPDGSARLRLPTGPAVVRAAERVLPRLPGAELDTGAPSSELRLPGGWLE